MFKFFYKIKREKIFLALILILICTSIFDFSILIFDIIQFFQIKNNSAMISPKFLSLNITMIVLSAVSLFVIGAYLIFRLKRISSKHEKV